MNHLFKKLEYSFFDKEEIYRFPETLTESVSLIRNFFDNSQKNKICLVFPAKELVAQWISLPIILFQIEKDPDSSYKCNTKGLRKGSLGFLSLG